MSNPDHLLACDSCYARTRFPTLVIWEEVEGEEEIREEKIIMNSTPTWKFSRQTETSKWTARVSLCVSWCHGNASKAAFLPRYFKPFKELEGVNLESSFTDSDLFQPLVLINYLFINKRNGLLPFLDVCLLSFMWSSRAK